VTNRQTDGRLKSKGSTSCYSANSRDSIWQSRKSEVAADGHELMMPRRIVRPSTARTSRKSDRRCSTQTPCTSQSGTRGNHSASHLLISISLRRLIERGSMPESIRGRVGSGPSGRIGDIGSNRQNNTFRSRNNYFPNS